MGTLMFKIIIACYNAELWIEKCIRSVLSQTVTNFEIIVVNDGSTDQTAAILNSLSDSRIHIISNSKNLASPLGSIILGIDNSRAVSDDILIILDGDDYLIDNLVLVEVQKAYTGDVWLTYGNYCCDRAPSVCHHLTDTNNYRRSGVNQWCTSHLKTFKKHLFDRANRRDFFDYDGQPYRFASDLALMYPLVELAGPSRIRFIERCLYYYNINSGSEGYRASYHYNIHRIIDRICTAPIYSEV